MGFKVLLPAQKLKVEEKHGVVKTSINSGDFGKPSSTPKTNKSDINGPPIDDL
tara:strand:- start:313 stop:471 length:159 start_codon:yes stop_codon:yes gene_type:complete